MQIENCKKCGRMNKLPNQEFCYYCGAKLSCEEHDPVIEVSKKHRISTSQFLIVIGVIITLISIVILLKNNNKADDSKLASKNSEIIDSGIVEYAGKAYHIVQIGTQSWLKENLDVGTMVVGNTNQNNNNLIEKYCYNDDPVNCSTYGGLYQWNEAMQYSVTEGAQGICPTGWHIPNKAEFITLAKSVNKSSALKALGQGTEEGTGTNTSGFSALLSGFRSDDGGFRHIHSESNFWISSDYTEYGNSAANYLYLGFSDNHFYFDATNKVVGLGVRCLKDNSKATNSSNQSNTVVYEGTIYHTIQIGSQVWFKENLDIGTVIPGSAKQTNNKIIEKYCYNDDTANCNTYGGLYQWDEVMQYSTTEGAQGICPTGWHIPTYGEMQTLGATLGNDGNTLKAPGEGFGEGTGTNISGFAAFFSGDRNEWGYFNNIAYNAIFWSSSETDTTNAYYLNLYYEDEKINFNYDKKNYGYSIRCLKD